MSTNTRVSPPPPNTSYGPKKSGRVSSSTPPATDTVCFNQEQVGRQFGWVVVLTAERRYTRPGHQAPYVLTHCTGCGAERWINWSSLTRGKSKGCQSCSKPRRIPFWLDRRLNMAKQRCTNTKSPQWEDYGGRGIQFRFPSALEAGLWVIANIGLEENKELDRVDNNGHYEPGNLKRSTRREQVGNRRNSKRAADFVWVPEEWPYAWFTVRRKIAEGKTREQIITDARLAVTEKRRGWRSIEARLASMIS